MATVKSVYSIITSPLVTEKTTLVSPYRQYVFSVAKSANKIEIKRAVEKIYNVKVEKVTTTIVKGRAKRLRWNQPGRTPDWKKAAVTLKKGFEIKLA
ncbi:MAG: 50S ribosomal protein L23 [Candidatus Omnitrophota bacterium]|nr:MAG: 50S ribosomal protein L23 [Candidatus Omnitrophota bacterium]